MMKIVWGNVSMALPRNGLTTNHIQNRICILCRRSFSLALPFVPLKREENKRMIAFRCRRLSLRKCANRQIFKSVLILTKMAFDVTCWRFLMDTLRRSSVQESDSAQMAICTFTVNAERQMSDSSTRAHCDPIYLEARSTGVDALAWIIMYTHLNVNLVYVFARFIFYFSVVNWWCALSTMHPISLW